MSARSTSLASARRWGMRVPTDAKKWYVPGDINKRPYRVATGPALL